MLIPGTHSVPSLEHHPAWMCLVCRGCNTYLRGVKRGKRDQGVAVMLAECSCFIPVLPHSMCGAAKAIGSGCDAAPAHAAPARFPELSECRFLSVRKGMGSSSLMQSDTPGCLKAQQAAGNAVVEGGKRGDVSSLGLFWNGVGGQQALFLGRAFSSSIGMPTLQAIGFK